MSRKARNRLQISRVYDPPTAGAGRRILVDRLWPRGVKKEEASIDRWMKEVAPSTGLRQWFRHAPDRWDEFRRRYFAELDARPDAWEELRQLCSKGAVTLVYAAKDEAHNNAAALQEYLESQGVVP